MTLKATSTAPKPAAAHTPEILIYALPKGETERYMEDLLSSRCKTAADVAAVKAAASKDGWHSFRVATWNGDAPDFAGTVAK